MIKSMTGYGGGKSACADYEFTVELKSVNNRFADISVRSPRGFLFAEEPIKAAVQARVSRGKLDLFLSYNAIGQSDIAVTVNDALAAQYKAAVDKIASDLGLDSELSAYEISRYADVLTLEKRELDKDSVLAAILEAVEAALAEHEKMRLAEGQKLCDDMLSRLSSIEDFVARVEERSPETVREYREKLTIRMQEILENNQIEESRILTEAAIFADRVAVDEETVRLRSHIEQMRLFLSDGIPIGRKLDFVVQEMNREANTIGSKCNDNEISRIVLEVKSEIEKIREQVQNIE